MSKIKYYSLVTFFISVLFILIYYLINNYFNIVWAYLLIEIQSLQRGFHLELSQSIRNIQNNGLIASISLITLSFIYGVFHAIGPGHGKIIISTYLLTQESKLKRGILLSMTSSIFQGFTAIFLVLIITIILNFSFRETLKFSSDIEIVSYILITLVGLYIIFTKLIKIIYKIKYYFSHSEKNTQKLQNQNSHHHHSHSHGPSVEELNESSLKSLLSISFAIGIRPCSGAIIVLLLSFSLKLYISGILSVLVMSVGTGLSISILAAISVYGRKTAMKLLSLLPDETGNSKNIFDWISLFGGIIILVFGLLLIQSSLLAPSHPFI